VVAKGSQIAVGIGLSLLGVICLLTLSLIAGIVLIAIGVAHSSSARPPNRASGDGFGEAPRRFASTPRGAAMLRPGDWGVDRT
jgi:hypothetical protein